MWGWTDWVWNQMTEFYDNLWNIVTYIFQWLDAFLKWALTVFKAIGHYLASGFRWALRHLQALRHLNFRSIWAAIKRGYERLRRALDWYMRNVQGPLDKIRQRILEIYRRFFQPIIRFLDSLRVFTRFIALFNRKLAAKLDARLWSLESKILFPITAMLRRVNSISSQIRAYFTALGLLDRVLLLESMRRDVSLVWEVLTNPRGRIFAPTPALGSYTYSDLHADVEVYGKTRGGPIADYIDEAHRSVREEFLGVL